MAFANAGISQPQENRSSCYNNLSYIDNLARGGFNFDNAIRNEALVKNGII